MYRCYLHFIFCITIHFFKNSPQFINCEFPVFYFCIFNFNKFLYIYFCICRQLIKLISKCLNIILSPSFIICFNTYTIINQLFLMLQNYQIISCM